MNAVQSMPASAPSAAPSSRGVREAGSIPSIPQPAQDDAAGWADYMRRAFAGEIEAF